MLAAVASDAGDGAAWVDRPIGARDAQLMRLRCEWFGPQFDGRVDCPACGDALSFTLDLRRFAHALTTDTASCEVSVAGTRFRLATSRDLAAIADAADVDSAEHTLLSRLQIEGGHEIEWSDAQRSEIEAALDAADPGAQIELDLACAECGTQWRAPLDIAASLWDELQAHAQNIVGEVHQLASSYGWSERDILAMSPARRRLYLPPGYA
jgi:HD-GYP domain-containing protein (c-di-GMP phosphodiesterase class II)